MSGSSCSTTTSLPPTPTTRSSSKGEALHDRALFAVPALAIRAPLPAGAKDVGTLSPEVLSHLSSAVSKVGDPSAPVHAVAGRPQFAVESASDLAELRYPGPPRRHHFDWRRLLPWHWQGPLRRGA